MTARGVPSRPDRCGKWMPLAGEYCARPAHGASRACASAQALQRQYDKANERQARRDTERYAWLDAYKLARGCEGCGYRADPRALDFDHTDPASKVDQVSSMLGRPWQAILDEIAKCRILCACCHRVKTFGSRPEKYT